MTKSHGRPLFAVSVLGVLVLPCLTFADWWARPEQQEFTSAKGAYVLRTTPHKEPLEHPGNCKGQLFKVESDVRSLVWSRYLVNNYAPLDVYVADSGEYVVTMDEWYLAGNFPIVIYGPAGKLVRVHTCETLGLEEDRDHITQSCWSFWWKEDAIIFFGPKEQTFFIRLHWGKMLMLDLTTGDIIDEKWHEQIEYDRAIGIESAKKKPDLKTLRQFGRRRTREIAVAYLRSEHPDQRKVGALVVGQLKLRQTIPRLRELLTDAAGQLVSTGYPETKWFRIYYVRKAAKESLQAMGEEVEDVRVEQRITQEQVEQILP